MPDSVLDEIKKPSAWLAIIIAIVAIPLGIYVTSLFERHGAPVYDVQQVAIFDQVKVNSNLNNNEGLLYVIDRNGTKIDKNIFAATLKIWNNGTANIKPEDVRIPFKIELSGINNIINFREIGETKENMDHFSLSTDDNHILSWANFDPSQGVTISIVYASETQSKISVSGYAVNSKDIEQVVGTSLNPFDRRGIPTILSALIIAFCILISGSSFDPVYRKRLNASPIEWAIAGGGLGLGVCGFIYLLFLISSGNHIDYAPF